MTNSVQENLKKGVDTYNKDNKENKENKNNYCPLDYNSFQIQSLGIASYEALSPLDFSQVAKAEPIVSVEATAPTPLTADQIRSCVYQLFDNGEQALQRYKFKIRFNLTDGTNPEFIASLTKDFRNFKKYIPEKNRQLIIDVAADERKRIKKLTGSWPYLGKLHANPGAGAHRKTIQIEPDTLVVVWWDAEERGWSGVVKLQNWVHEFDLFDQYLTAKQKSQGVRAQDNWQNPKYNRTVRPLTWAEQRGQK